LATKEDIERNAKLANIPVYSMDEKAVLLGSTCGKPYPASVLAVVDAGNSDILEVIKK